MQTEVLKQFLVSLGFDVDESSEKAFTAGVTRAAATVAGLAAATAAAVGGLAAWATSTAHHLDQMGDRAEILDLLVSEMQELGYVAELTGSSLEASDSSLAAFTRAVGDTAQGIGRATKVFDSLGISVKGVDGAVKPTIDLLFEVGEAIKDLSRGEQLAVLERLGIDRTMLTALTTDTAGLREEFRRMQGAAGLNLDEAVGSAGDYIDELFRLRRWWNLLVQSVGVVLIGKFRRHLTALRQWITDNFDRIQRVVRAAVSVVSYLADVFGVALGIIWRTGSSLVSLFAGMSDHTQKAIGLVLGLAAAFELLSAAFLATPIGMLVAGLAGLWLLLEDFQTWSAGGESLVDWSQFETGAKIIESFLVVVGGLMTGFMQLIDAVILLVSGKFSDSMKAFGDLWGTLGNVGRVMSGSLFRSGGAPAAASGAATAPSAADRAQAWQAAQSGATLQQQTNINVVAPAPDAAARAVAWQQAKVNADAARNLRGAVR